MTQEIKLIFDIGCSLAFSDAATVFLSNMQYGFAIWTKDSDPANSSLWLRFPLMDDGTETVDTYAGYTKLCVCPSGDEIWNRSENKFNLPIYGALTVDEILVHPDKDKKIFFNERKDDNGTTTGIYTVLVYPEEITGDCLARTLEYLESQK